MSGKRGSSAPEYLPAEAISTMASLVSHQTELFLPQYILISAIRASSLFLPPLLHSNPKNHSIPPPHPPPLGDILLLYQPVQALWASTHKPDNRFMSKWLARELMASFGPCCSLPRTRAKAELRAHAASAIGGGGSNSSPAACRRRCSMICQRQKNRGAVSPQAA